MPDTEWRKGQRQRVARRRAAQAKVFEYSWVVRLAFGLAGLIWMILIPTDLFVKKTWVDEHALQANSVKTHWDWPNVRQADYYLETMESMRDQNATRPEFTSFLIEEFRKMGLLAQAQTYELDNMSENNQGVNVYSALSAPRATSAEAIIISTSWRSLYHDPKTDARGFNFRAIAMILAIAKQYKEHSYWAKDIVFVISDGYLDGMHAFLSSYHGVLSSPGLRVDPLESLPYGVVWAALCIDYPGHSFSELGIFFEGINGRLPNQDLINSIGTIARWTGNVPVVLYDQNMENYRPTLPSYTPEILRSNAATAYFRRAYHILRHVGYQASGRPSGVHGLFHQYRIDAITLFAVPASGPHGFHALGRVMESSLRTINNLLERLHASFFFYLFTAHEEFVVIGKYLTSAVFIGVSLELSGLYGWVASGWQVSKTSGDSLRVTRPLVPVLIIMIGTHVIGGLLGALLMIGRLASALQSLPGTILLLSFLAAVPILAISLIRSQVKAQTSQLQPLLDALTLCMAGTVVCVVSVLNFGLAAALSLAFGAALPFRSSRPNRRLPHRLVRFVWISLANPAGVAAIAASILGWDPVRFAIRSSMEDWAVYRVWTYPFVMSVYTPLIWQAAIGSLLA